MKKFLSIIVVTAMVCAFTACENNTADEIESSVTSVAEVSEETTEEITEEITTEEETTEEITTEETTEKITEEETTEEITETESENVTPENASEYREVLETFLEYTNSNDIENIMKITFPDKYIDVMKTVAENSDDTIEDTIGYINNSNETIRLVEIISDETASNDDIEFFHKYYGLFQMISDYLDENGTDNFNKWIYSLNVRDMEYFADTYFHIDDIRIIECMVEYTNSDGYSYTEERPFILYHIDGEGWKVEMAILGYKKESKKKSLNSDANTFKTSINSAFVYFNEKCPEKYIICSDKSKNYNVTEDFVSKFEKHLRGYFSYYDEFDYIIVLNGDECVYVACADSDNPKYIGTYPENSLYSAEEYTDMDREYTFDEIYNICLDEIKK